MKDERGLFHVFFFLFLRSGNNDNAKHLKNFLHQYISLFSCGKKKRKKNYRKSKSIFRFFTINFFKKLKNQHSFFFLFPFFSQIALPPLRQHPLDVGLSALELRPEALEPGGQRSEGRGVGGRGRDADACQRTRPLLLLPQRRHLGLERL